MVYGCKTAHFLEIKCTKTVVLQTVLGVPFFVYSSIKEIQLFQDNLLSMPLTYPNNAVIILEGVKWANFP